MIFGRLKSFRKSCRNSHSSGSSLFFSSSVSMVTMAWPILWDQSCRSTLFFLLLLYLVQLCSAMDCGIAIFFTSRLISINLPRIIVEITLHSWYCIWVHCQASSIATFGGLVHKDLLELPLEAGRERRSLTIDSCNSKCWCVLHCHHYCLFHCVNLNFTHYR